MRSTFTRIIAIILCFSVLFPFVFLTEVHAGDFFYNLPPKRVENDPNDPDAAQDISGMALIAESIGFKNSVYLFNDEYYSSTTTYGEASLTLEHPDGIGYLYFMFDAIYGPYTVTNNDTGTTVTVGESLFVHDLIDLTQIFGSTASSVTVRFDNGPAKIIEL